MPKRVTKRCFLGRWTIYLCVIGPLALTSVQTEAIAPPKRSHCTVKTVRICKQNRPLELHRLDHIKRASKLPVEWLKSQNPPNGLSSNKAGISHLDSNQLLQGPRVKEYWKMITNPDR